MQQSDNPAANGAAPQAGSVVPGRAAAPGVLDAEAFRRLVEGARDYAIFMLNPDGVVISWNDGAERIKGYRADEIIGRHFSVFYTQEALDAGWPAEELRRARTLGRFEDEGWRVRKDGGLFWANVVITAIRDADGELRGYSKITRDLSERRRNERNLAESEENLRLLIEGVKDHAIFGLDATGRVRDWNAGAERVLGFRRDEVVGRHVSIFFNEEDVAAGKPQRELDAARDSGYAEAVGWRVKADGTSLWADVTLTALRERDGSLRGFVQIIRDLSERQRVHELESEGRRISEFIAMLSHELRNPLGPIRNAVGILGQLEPRPPAVWRRCRNCPLLDRCDDGLGEQLVLVGHVPIQGHGGDAQLGRDSAHGERAEPFGVGGSVPAWRSLVRTSSPVSSAPRTGTTAWRSDATTRSCGRT